MAKPEVLTPDIIQDVPLEKVIENTLVKNNVTDKVINALKKQYSGMALKALDDKQGYLEIKDARNAVRKVGILVEKCCKAGRDDANKIRGMWIDKEKEVLAKVAEVQDPLDAEIKRFEDEKARLDLLEEQQREEKFMLRQTTLLKMEAKYEGNSFSLGAVSYDLNNIKEADEEIWTDTILPKFQREFAKVEAEKAELEKQKKEAEDKLRAEQAELKKQQDELARQREEMRLQQESLQKQQQETERQKREQEERQRIEKANAEEKLWRNRLSQMDGIGWNSQFAFVRGGNEEEQIITYENLIGFTDAQFAEIRDKFNSEQNQRDDKKRIADEEKKQLEIKQAEEAAAIKERQRIEAEQKQAEIQRQQEEQRKAEEAAKASDKEKWQSLLSTVNAIILPEFKSGIYKGKLSSLKGLIQQINEL